MQTDKENDLTLKLYIMKSFIRWAGSKKQSVDELSSYWSTNFTRYVEPFAGSACLFFKLQPKHAILGDLNKDLINVYNSIKISAARVHKYYSTIPNTSENYYIQRAIRPEDLNRFDRAGRFVYLNRYCFNGLYRTNLKGQFNVPYGGLKSGSLPSYEELLSYRRVLKNANCISGDFSIILDKVKKGDFVYIDPPYSVKNKRVFKEYDSSIFSEADLHRLRLYLDDFDRRGITFLVSYSDDVEANILADGFNKAFTSVRRNIAGFSGHRKRDSEVLISNINLV